ncbi:MULTISPECIES: LCP family protein [Streptomyces]|uniref:LCP family protein n=1 Tax=Streptomyces doudnae TaxID=3075536 RepID=A0ABD5EYJ2_9ACTN|nr:MULTISPECIES: LCP family protein [unclassified Streptomyces]MDT0439079.1 LCP family protein [Streptomyces sp. DSM 41981]MYQ64824.1 LytR family transcriptional regulator [Streptomyces sp. SID4950]SCD86918.1 transcriptional attenuator, LytR family [Streptomyces sp. SolWspMP-5a-2]
MNDRYDAGYGNDQYELVGYDEYGQPVYRQAQPPQHPQQYDPYAQQQQQQQQQQHPQQGYQQQGQQQQQAQQQGQQGYGYDPYATGGQQGYDPYGTGRQPAATGYDPYGQQTSSYDPYGRSATGPQPRVTEQTAYIPQQSGPSVPPQQPSADGRETDRQETTDRQEGGQEPEQFAFVEEPDGDSEDVIDWLNFTENRTERREEAKRRARTRVVALVVALAVAAVGGVGYLWYAGKLPGLSSSDSARSTATSASAQNRDVVVVHLHDTKSDATSTALLVDNTTAKQGTTVLLPNSLALTDDDGGGSTTLAKSVDDDGSSGTREALDTVLGTDIEGTWRLDTPYLQNLVDLVGNIEVDTNADVPDPEAKKKGTAPLVHQGKNQTLSGKAAVAYATHRASGEAQNAQLERFGQVVQAVLRKISSDAQAATVTVQTLAQILDPSLTDKDLGGFLAKLSELAKGGDYKTAMLPVQSDGTLSTEASASVVKDVLGGTAKSPDQGSAVRVSVQNASGTKDDTEKARVVLLNGGFTFLDGGTSATPRAASQVVYTDADDKENASEVAKTLGLPTGSVTKGKTASNADVTVVLGQDYRPSSGTPAS